MQRRLLFPSPVFFDRPSGHDALRESLRQHALSDQPLDDIFSHPEPAFRALRALVLAGFQDAARQQLAGDVSFTVAARAWLSVIRPGEHLPPRRYSDAHWAGFYVVDAGDQPAAALPAGSIGFLDPRGAVRGDDPLGVASSHHELAPVDGLLLIFPGWLLHHAHPYRGQRPRVLAGFTLTLQPAAQAPTG